MLLRSSRRPAWPARALVYETSGFTDYFFNSTPIREIAELNIGSRPASRKASQKIEGLACHSLGLQLGAVPPYVAGVVWLWFCRRSLCECRGKDPKTVGPAAKVYRQWPFFRTLLSNMDMVLAKTIWLWHPATAGW